MAPTVITLADYMNLDIPTVEKGCVQQIREDSQLLNTMSFVTSNQLKFYNRLGPSSLQGGTWKSIGEDYESGVQGEFKLIEETTFYVGREFSIDRRLQGVSDFYVGDPVKENIQLYTRGIQRQVCNGIINGKSTDNDGKSFAGLRERIAALPSEQTIQAVDSSHALDMRTGAADYAQNVEEFIVLINKLMKRIEGGRPDFFIVNEDFQIKFESILRTSGLLTMTKDNMDREFPSYKGIPFIDAGRCEDDATQIITNSETITGADGTVGTDFCTSIYAVKQGPSYFTMLEKQPFQVRENDYDPHGNKHNVVMDWGLGMMITHPRSVARLQGIRMA